MGVTIGGPVVDRDDPDLLRRHLGEVERLAHVGSWEWDVTSDRITWSEELFRLYGVEPEGFAATFESYLSLIHPDDRAMVAGTVERSHRRGEAYAFEHRLVRPDGEVRWLRCRGDVELDADGRVVRLFGIAVDVTDRTRILRELREFIANAAHELRTPVAAITTAAHLLGDGAGSLPEGERARVVGALARNAGRLERLTASLLDLSAIEAGPVTLMLRPVVLAGIVARSVELSRPTTGDDERVTVEVPPELVVRAAPAELERVLVNLLVNARDHGGPNIGVRARRDGAQVVIEVCDDGPGVDPDVVGDLFTPFVRGRRTRGRGSGLGLAIVRELVTRLGGSIEHRGGRPGACFVVRLEASR